MAIKILQKISKIFTNNTAKNMRSKKTYNFKPDLKQTPDQFISETEKSKRFLDNIGDAIKDAESEKNYLPDFIQRDGDHTGIKWGEAVFPPEEVEKMKNMSAKERIEYKQKLLNNGNYITKWDE